MSLSVMQYKTSRRSCPKFTLVPSNGMIWYTFGLSCNGCPFTYSEPTKSGCEIRMGNGRSDCSL